MAKHSAKFATRKFLLCASLLQGEEPVSQGSRLCRVIRQASLHPGHWGARTLFDRFIVVFIHDPACPGNLARAGFLTSFFDVFVAKLGIFLALHTRFPGHSVGLAFLYLTRVMIISFLYSPGLVHDCLILVHTRVHPSRTGSSPY